MKTSLRYRLFYITITVMTLLLAIILVSRILGYVHSGAITESTYELGIAQLKNHNPSMKWLEDDSNIEGTMTKFLRKEIAEAYSDAWGLLNLSIVENKDLGLVGYYTKPKIDAINSISYEEGLITKRTDLSHQMKLHFISLDNQVISFTDYDVVLETTYTGTNKPITVRDTSDYRIIMTRNDGRWLVNKLVRE